MMIRKNDFSHSQEGKNGKVLKGMHLMGSEKKEFKHLPSYWSLPNCQRSIFLTVPLFFPQTKPRFIERCQMQTKQSWEFHYQLAFTLSSSLVAARRVGSGDESSVVGCREFIDLTGPRRSSITSDRKTWRIDFRRIAQRLILKPQARSNERSPSPTSPPSTTLLSISPLGIIAN